MKVIEAIKYGIDELTNLEDKILKIKILLSYCMKVEKEYLITHDQEELKKAVEEKYKNGIQTLNQGTPIQYITGIQEFYRKKIYSKQKRINSKI